MPWHALKFNLQLTICCFMPILAAVVVIVGTLIATTCTQPPHLPSLLSTTYHSNKQLVDLYYKIIFTPSSRHKKQETSRGSFAAAVRRCRNKHRERGGARERKREGSSAVKLALNYLARSWFPPLPLRLAQVKAGHIVCKSARAAAQAGWGKRASKGQRGLWQCKFIT